MKEVGEKEGLFGLFASIFHNLGFFKEEENPLFGHLFLFKWLE